MPELIELQKARADISAYLRTLLPENWKDWTLEERRAFWMGNRQGGTILRDRVCAKEIWMELYGGDPLYFNGYCARVINGWIQSDSPYWRVRSSANYGPIYGRQRGFVYDFVSEKICSLIRLSENTKSSE